MKIFMSLMPSAALLLASFALITRAQAQCGGEFCPPAPCWPGCQPPIIYYPADGGANGQADCDMVFRGSEYCGSDGNGDVWCCTAS